MRIIFETKHISENRCILKQKHMKCIKNYYFDAVSNEKSIFY